VSSQYGREGGPGPKETRKSGPANSQNLRSSARLGTANSPAPRPAPPPPPPPPGATSPPCAVASHSPAAAAAAAAASLRRRRVRCLRARRRSRAGRGGAGRGGVGRGGPRGRLVPSMAVEVHADHLGAGRDCAAVVLRRLHPPDRRRDARVEVRGARGVREHRRERRSTHALHAMGGGHVWTGRGGARGAEETGALHNPGSKGAARQHGQGGAGRAP